MHARLPILTMLLAGGLAASARADCPDCAAKQARRAMEKKTAALVRSSIYAFCGVPAGIVMDRMGMTRELANADFVLSASGTSTCMAMQSPSADPAPACPYLDRESRSKACADSPCRPVSVEENLKKIEKAGDLLRKAERLRLRGKREQAVELYEQVQKLCPGSSCDERASQCLEKMSEAVEEQELPPATPARKKPAPDAARINEVLDRCRAAVEAGDYKKAEHLMVKSTWMLHKLQLQASAVSAEEAQEAVCPVERLLGACHDALTAGRLDQAQELARKAMDLDPVAVAADALNFKTHMLVQLREKLLQQKDEPKVPEVYPGCVEVCPSLPAVAPLGSAFLEDLERQIAEIGLARLDIFAEEACEEQETPAAAPLVIKLELDVPCFCLPKVGKLVLKAETQFDGFCPAGICFEFAAAAEEEAETRTSGMDWVAYYKALQTLVNEGPSLEIDCAPFGGEFRFGYLWQDDAVGFRWQYNQSGRGGLALMVEGPELRAAEQLFKRQIFEWIKSLGNIIGPAVEVEGEGFFTGYSPEGI